MTRFILNGETTEVDADESMPLLWALRDVVGLKGTKFGCGIAQCGACTVIVDGNALRSCVTPLSVVEGLDVTTVEGLSEDGTSALQNAWCALNVPQCGYCQAGQLMSATALLERSPEPTDAEIDQAMAGNICRCGTYQRIRAAIHLAAEAKRGNG